MLRTVLGAFCILSHLIFKTTIRNENYPYFTDEQPGTQKFKLFPPSLSLFLPLSFNKLELKSLIEHGAFFQGFTFSEGSRIILT